MMMKDYYHFSRFRVFTVSCFFVLFFFTQANAQVWHDRTLSDSTNIFDMAFADSLHGYAIGDSNLLLRSTNGGADWHRVTGIFRQPGQLVRIQIVDSLSIVILGRYEDISPFVLYSEDAGQTWNIADNFPAGLILMDVCFAGKELGIACGMSGAILRTTDFMRNWEQIVDSASFLPHLRVRISPRQHIWILGGRIDQIGYARASTDNGTTWTAKIDAIEPLRDIAFIGQDTIFVVGGDPEFGGWIYASTDAGETWALQNVPEIAKTLQACDFSVPNSAWVTGAGAILHSTNLGREWKLEKFINETVYRCVHRTPKSIWFAGSRGFFSEYIDTTGTVGIEATVASDKPSDFTLQIWPNPSNGQVNYFYQIPRKMFVKIQVYNILGSCIKTLTEQAVEPGIYKGTFSSENVVSGIYFLRITSGEFDQIRKLIILK